MNPWFRFYHEVLDDPKVQRLDPATFKHWINLLCLAARHSGRFPSSYDTAFALRIDEIALESVLDRLLIAGLIEVRKGGPNGSYIAPHGWDKRQYKSDGSTERVKRFRERSKTVTETAPDTEADTESEKKEPNGSCASSAAPSLTIEEVVEDWNVMANQLGLPVVKKITPARRKAFRGRLLEYPDLQDWQDAFRCVRNAPWMHGRNDRNWKADFDFLLQAKSFTRLTEDAYGKA